MLAGAYAPHKFIPSSLLEIGSFRADPAAGPAAARGPASASWWRGPRTAPANRPVSRQPTGSPGGTGITTANGGDNPRRLHPAVISGGAAIVTLAVFGARCRGVRLTGSWLVSHLHLTQPIRRWGRTDGRRVPNGKKDWEPALRPLITHDDRQRQPAGRYRNT
jgi:hypothetical protein